MTKRASIYRWRVCCFMPDQAASFTLVKIIRPALV